MIVYVESNFVLELALLQEQAGSCEEILDLCKKEYCHLSLPAFCIAEPYETLVRRHKSRSKLAQELSSAVKQLGRSRSYGEQGDAIKSITALLIKSAEQERSRLHSTLDKILSVAVVIPLSSETLCQAARAESQYHLSPQDAVIYASVLQHLRASDNRRSCFLNKNSKDFDDPDIVTSLLKLGCKLLPRFDSGLDYIRSNVHPDR